MTADPEHQCCGGGCADPLIQVQATPKPRFQIGQRVRRIPHEGTVTAGGKTWVNIELDNGDTWSEELYPEIDPKTGEEYNADWEILSD